MRYFYFFSILACLVQSCNSPKKTLIFTDALFTEGIEGPAVGVNGDLYLVNFQSEGTIAKVKKGTDIPELCAILPDSGIGNGIRFLNDTILYVADYINHKIWSMNINTLQMLVHASNPMMNQPNDIAIMKNGILFASDPNWKKGNGQLWKINVDGSNELLEENMGTTNGIEVSPKDEFLYVNESVQRKIWRYTLDSKGNVSNKSLFYTFPDFGLDGMRCDSVGNLYVARYEKGTVAVISAQGQLLEEVILVGKKPTNVTFGGPNFQTVFVTLQDKRWVEIFKANFRGREPFN